MSYDVAAYQARGCDYLFEHYEDHGVVVVCWNDKDQVVWSGSTSWTPKVTRVVDVVRTAREAYEIRKSEWGY